MQEIERELGDLIFGAQEDELEHVVLRLLDQQQLTLASAEIGAASWVSEWMLKGADVTGGEDPELVDHTHRRTPQFRHGPTAGYVGGLAFPTLEGAQRWLASEPKDELSIWERLAQLCQNRFEADVVLVVGSYPSQSVMARALEPFTFHFGLKIGQDYYYQHRSMAGHPDVLGPRAAKCGLDWLRRMLTQRNAD